MRHEFASAAWFTMVGAHVLERLEAARRRDPGRDLTFSICEVFSDPPAHLRRAGRRTAWYCRAEGGRFEFSDDELANAQYKVTAPYDDILPLVRFRLGGDPDRASAYAALGAALAKSGGLTVQGILPRLPEEFATLHDAIADGTL